MTKRKECDQDNPIGNSEFYTEDQWNQDIKDLHQTIQAVGYISDEMGNEIRKQNELLDRLTLQYQEGVNALQRLNEKLKKIFGMSNYSPMTLMFFFTIGVIIFLWFYWKFMA